MKPLTKTNFVKGMMSKFYRKIIKSFYIFFEATRNIKEPIFKELVPPLNLNYNLRKKFLFKKIYQSQFSRSHLVLISNLINRSFCKDIRTGKVKPKILDIGCGLGRLAIATKFMLESSKCLTDNNIKKDEIKYVGIDIRKDAIDWLKNAYENDKSFYFHHHEANKDLDYIGDKRQPKTNATSNGNESNYSLDFTFKADIQWSGSFFTHLTPQGASSALKFIRSSLDEDGIAVNTWLIADTQSCMAMKCEEADRYLEYDFGEFLTDQIDNPLGCTAFKKDFIEKVYEEADLNIVEILLGSWRGFGKTNGLHYQDIIIATPKK